MSASTTHGPDRDADATALTSGRLLARNAAWNFASQCAPMAVAVVTVPILIAGLGTDRFGVLTLAWMVLGYFSLFDLGLGRALTQMVAEKLGRGEGRELPTLVGTALLLMLGLGAVGGGFVAAVSPWMVNDVLKIPAPLRRESLGAFYLMAVALPFVISTAGLRGVMEAHQRFGAINVVRTVIGLYSLGSPLLVLPFTSDLVPIVAVIFAGRVASWAIHVVLCFRTIPDLRRSASFQAKLFRPLLGYGGWMTLTNLINPLMVQMDRFLVGALLSTAAVAYYTTPYDLITRFWFLSNAILGVMFPAFATSFVQDRARTSLIFARCVKYVFLILFPIMLGAIALADEGIGLWLGADFARQSAPVLRWLAVGVFLNGLAQVPSALTQAVGRPDLTFKLHLIELPLYLVAAWFLIRHRGIEGAAIAWTARTALDFALFFAASSRLLPDRGQIAGQLLRGLTAALVAMGLCALPIPLTPRVALLTALLALTAAIAWRAAFSADEKATILSRLPIGRLAWPPAVGDAAAEPTAPPLA